MVMKKLLLELWRDMRRTRTRYLSILMIVALGVGFFVGIKVTCPNMLITANNYYRDANLLDFRLMCNYGLTEEDAAATAGIDLTDKEFWRSALQTIADQIDQFCQLVNGD